MSKNEDPYFVTSGSPYYDREIETKNLFDTGATLYIEKRPGTGRIGHEINKRRKLVTLFYDPEKQSTRDVAAARRELLYIIGSNPQRHIGTREENTEEDFLPISARAAGGANVYKGKF